MVLAREVSMEEVAAIRENTDIEIEAFIHGAMCISYSGRCTLSNHMSMRDANRGGCSQSCRWKYELFDMPFGTERRSKTSEGEVEEEFSMSAVDMSMIEHIPELIENGVDSFKIEGRMKSIHYVSTVANVYKKAVDSYMEDPENYVCQQEWIDELWKVAQRELATGFYYNTPSEDEQLFGERRKRRKSQRFVNGTFSVSAMKLNFMVPGLPISTKPLKRCIMKTVKRSIGHLIP